MGLDFLIYNMSSSKLMKMSVFLPIRGINNFKDTATTVKINMHKAITGEKDLRLKKIKAKLQLASN